MSTSDGVQPILDAKTIVDSLKSGRLNQITEPLLGQTHITQEYLTVLIHAMTKDPTRLQLYLDRLEFEGNNLNIEKTIFELIEAGMSENAQKFAEKRSPSSYVKILLRNAVCQSEKTALESYSQIILYINNQPFKNKIALIKSFGKTLVDSLLPLNGGDDLIKKITDLLVSLFIDKPSNEDRLDPGDFLSIMENCQQQQDNFLRKIQAKIGELAAQNEKVGDLLIEMDLKSSNPQDKNKAITLYKSADSKKENLKNLFFQSRILDEVVNDQDEKVLCLLQEKKTCSLEENMNIGIHYLPLICEEEVQTNSFEGFEKFLKSTFQEGMEHMPPHKIISVLEILSNPEFEKNVQFDSKIKESLKTGLSFIDEVPTLREAIEERQNSLSDHLVFRQTRCANCGQEFTDSESEYPIVHFHCGHSFHKKCLGSATECPKNHMSGPMKVIGEEEFERAVNGADFNGFYELINSVSSIFGNEKDEFAKESQLGQSEQIGTESITNNLPEPNEQMKDPDNYLQKIDTSNPFLVNDNTNTEKEENKEENPSNDLFNELF
ncbi:hypothetical protein EIN_429610 [Entamoeba invadens IP1]|uniref:RING-type domain-containing protein n=1 Tax=Entamoeba invadens IP1 TaxID=370355 RepID=A0A0A1UF17_ENTIV|nr:hypothetical protein EIN_429610 [Entamoeba invadens IP1]ELP95185.1 hypothetical protein EIN_429610 [Entamoeba invadens IP1]|eukprot:XP_004261956.1 hypothetical protein EIN_429610 [Entamoeba invadens IP1]